MTYKRFQQFCTDFDIFPDILTKSKTLSFFNTLASFQSDPNKLTIDEHLFVEALALTAFEVVYKDPQPDAFEKILLLLEKMN